MGRAPLCPLRERRWAIGRKGRTSLLASEVTIMREVSRSHNLLFCPSNSTAEFILDKAPLGYLSCLLDHAAGFALRDN